MRLSSERPGVSCAARGGGRGARRGMVLRVPRVSVAAGPARSLRETEINRVSPREAAIFVCFTVRETKDRVARENALPSPSPALLCVRRAATGLFIVPSCAAHSALHNTRRIG